MPRILDMPPGGRHDEGSTEYQEWRASQGREGNYQQSGGSSGGGGGGGRCSPASALVLTPQGWKEMGKVEVGSIQRQPNRSACVSVHSRMRNVASIL
jgi:hypothetical protein